MINYDDFSEAYVDDEGEEGDEDEGDSSELSVVPASSLAACMKVNSIYSPKIVPFLETKLSIAKFNIICGNSLSSMGKGELKNSFYAARIFNKKIPYELKNQKKFSIYHYLFKSTLPYR